MPSNNLPKAIETKKDIKKLIIISGEGNLVHNIISLCKKKNIEVFLFPLTKNENWDVEEDKIFKRENIVDFIKKNNLTDIIACGKSSRDFLNLWTFIREFKIISPTKNGLKNLYTVASFIYNIPKTKYKGDNSLLSSMIASLENAFECKIHCINNLFPELVAAEGDFALKKTPKSFCKDIEFGIKVTKTIGNLDIGQSIIIQNRNVIGVEAVEGTDNLLLRCKELLSKKHKPGILLKIKKPSQDPRVDLPAIGPKTIENAYNAGLAGIVIEANNTLIADKEEVIKKLNEYKMFALSKKIL